MCVTMQAVLYVGVGCFMGLVALVYAVYPMSTLRCYSTYTKPDGQLICPEARSKFCVKEVSTLRQDLCGHTQYFGDTYILNSCILRKCASECSDGSVQFDYGGVTYTRVRTCCNTDYCNTGTRSAASSSLLTLMCIALLSAVFSYNRPLNHE